MKKHDELSLDELKVAYQKVPRLGAELVIRNQQGTLLTLRAIKPSKGLWHLPGGTLYADERVIEGVQRIARAELGVDVTVDGLLGYVDYPDNEGEGGFGHSVGLYFACTPKSSNFRLDFQATAYKFFRELPDDMIKEHREFLNSLK